MKNIISIILITLIFTSCEKVVDIDYKANQSKIIIEGNITNETGPYFVKVTRSISLTNTGAYPTIDNAIVSIKDDAGNSEILTSQGNGLYKTNTIIGAQGRTYTLTVNAENETYVAQSTMPAVVNFDSIKVDKLFMLGDASYDIIPVFTDPTTKGNNYRFILYINNKLEKQHLMLNDEIKNGLLNTLRLEINDNDLDLKTNDIIALEMQCVDKNVALYYSTLVLMADSGPGGGVTPNNPPTNFSNGALGLFSAHTVQANTIILP